MGDYQLSKRLTATPPTADELKTSQNPTERVWLDAPHGVFNGPSRIIRDTQAIARRMDELMQLARGDALALGATVLPAYVAARDRLDVAASAERGGIALGLFARMSAAQSEATALSPHLLECSPATPLGGESFSDLPDQLPRLAKVIEDASLQAFLSLVPHQLHGVSIAGVLPMPEEVDSRRLRARLADELDRTLSLLLTVEEVQTAVERSRKVPDKAGLARARQRILWWTTRPIDIAFLKAALGETWFVLDAMSGSTDGLEAALTSSIEQASRTGWFADTRGVDMAEIRMWLDLGEASTVLAHLEAVPDNNRRGRILEQMRDAGLLERFRDAIGWKAIKHLHDGLGVGFGDVKTILQHRFIGGKDVYGPSLGEEWETHETSLNHVLGEVPYAGKLLNGAMDFATFGFSSSYGQIRDAYTSGKITEAEFNRDARNLTARTAAMAFASMVTGGVADKFVRGGAAAVSTARAIAAGAAGGSAGAAAGLGASDAYNVYVSHDQEHFSSFDAYLDTVLEGGAFGAGLSGAGIAAEKVRGGAPATPASGSKPGLAESGERARKFAPSTAQDSTLPAGRGVTDKYGNMRVSPHGTATDRALAEAHEKVHSALSPKALNGLREFRADVGLGAYKRSGLVRYLEEALAETVAQVKVNGMSVDSVLEGIRFPITHGYVTLSRVVTEAAIGTLVYGGTVYAVYVVQDGSQR